MPVRTSLSTKILLGVLTGTVIIFAALSMAAFSFTTKVLQQAIMESQLETARQTMNKIDWLLNERILNIQTIAGAPPMENFLILGNSELGDFRKVASKRINEFTFVTGPWDLLMVADKEGKIVLSSSEKEIGKSVKEQTQNKIAFEAVMREEFYYSDLVVSGNTSELTVIFAAPIRNRRAPKQPVIGAVIGHFAWPAVLQVLEDVSNHVLLVNKEGALIGQNMGHNEDLFTETAPPRILDDLKNGHSESVILQKEESMSGSQSLTSFAFQTGYLSYQGNGWGLLLEQPIRIVFEPARMTSMKLVGLLAPIILACVLLMMLMIVQWILRPIAVLTRITHEIAAGDLNKQAPADSQDEMGQLAASFNSMTDKLRKSYEGLEEKVKQRTQELSKTNEALSESERKTQLVIETAQDAFVAIDANGKITHWNRQAEHTFGWPSQAVIGKLLAELIIPLQYREAHKHGIERYHQTGEGPVLNKQIEITALHRDGHELPVELTIWPVRAGKEISFNAFIRDISERKKNESEIVASRARFQNILDMASDAIVSIDEKRQIILFNKQAQRIFGYEANEVLGTTLERLLPERFRERHPAHVKKFAAEGSSARLMSERPELFGLRKNGEEFPVEITISKVELAGEFILTAIIRDVTEQKKMECIVLQSEKMSAVGQLAAGVAHEINNPLGVILGFAQNVAKRIKPGDPFELPLKSIEREAVRCKNLVQDLLTFSRLGKGEKEFMDLREAIESALALVQAQSKVKNVDLVKEISEVPKIVANKNQIQQIIINLSNNAIDAMPNGGRLVIGVKKTMENGRDEVEIRVQDTGQGIPESIRAQIFNPFFTTKESGKGTGLGLSLVYEIVQKHSGRILLDSEMGKGTTFRILLPLG